ncbi:DUF3422 family protein [Kiloniella laminariae]|uniref:DUF3422 family protein n=1 Tax=Kiloniella laminariae TaxID=454162 RepID=UPI00037A3E61|nr:DUF3422 domain-containing protein [Kiloniella laminariae]
MLRDHPLRVELCNELHARPFTQLSGPETITHIGIVTGEGKAEEERRHVGQLCGRYNVAPPLPGTKHFMADFGRFFLVWERHTEFSTYTFFRNRRDPERKLSDIDPAHIDQAGDQPYMPFSRTAIALVPGDWLEGLSGDRLVGVHLELEGPDALERTMQEQVAFFPTGNLAASTLRAGLAAVWMDFSINEDGYGRILLKDYGLKPRQIGRAVQRLLEIETYRMMALLSLPLAQSYGARLAKAGKKLTDITSRMTGARAVTSEKVLLRELTELSAEIEQAAAETNYRFSASKAYHELVKQRTRKLREGNMDGFQRIESFLDRRLTPAMRTCEATALRLDTLSKRVARAGQLLRTRVDIQLEEQNSALLKSMDRRASLQLRLQETVEGLSVAAISYYVVSLIYYLAKGANDFGFDIKASLVAALSIPLVVIGLWLGVRRVRRIVTRDEGE